MNAAGDATLTCTRECVQILHAALGVVLDALVPDVSQREAIVKTVDEAVQAAIVAPTLATAARQKQLMNRAQAVGLRVTFIPRGQWGTPEFTFPLGASQQATDLDGLEQRVVHLETITRRSRR